MSIYKRYFDKTKGMYFMIKDEKIFDKNKKKNYSELIYNKKYLKAEKKFNTKESFLCFYIPVLLVDLFKLLS